MKIEAGSITWFGLLACSSSSWALDEDGTQYKDEGGAHISLIREKKPAQVVVGNPSRRRNSRQKAPPAGVAKIHVDAGLLRSASGVTAAAACRDDQGAFL